MSKRKLALFMLDCLFVQNLRRFRDEVRAEDITEETIEDMYLTMQAMFFAGTVRSRTLNRAIDPYEIGQWDEALRFYVRKNIEAKRPQVIQEHT